MVHRGKEKATYIFVLETDSYFFCNTLIRYLWASLWFNYRVKRKGLG